MKKKIAVIGTGIAGMGAAYFLRNEFDMEIFEKNLKFCSELSIKGILGFNSNGFKVFLLFFILMDQINHL